MALREAKVLACPLETKLPMEIRQTPVGIWLIVSLTRTLKVGLRMPVDAAGWRTIRMAKKSPSDVEITARGGQGLYVLRIQSIDGPASLIRCTTTLTPVVPVQFVAMPRDLCVLTGRLDPYPKPGRLLTCQTGKTAGQMFIEIPGKPGGTVFYFHNLSALTDLCQQTGCDVAGSVAAPWPDAGFSMPAGKLPLAAHKPLVIQDVFLELRKGTPGSEARAAEMFLDSLGRIYPQLQQPEVQYYDWPEMARKTLRAMNVKSGCCRTVDRKLYVQAYVDCSVKPPESMVQGAIMVPLMEYEAWQARAVPLLKKLAHVPETFYAPELKAPVRWLLGTDFEKEERSEEEHHCLMDSWYLLHTMMNLGRMGEMGNESARKIFLDSLDTIMRVARHFKHDWPVFYDQRNLRVKKEETGEGEGGERDSTGLYVHVMVQAYELTQQKKYLEEAEIGAVKLKGLLFGVLYQTNTTAFSALALAKLWKLTGNAAYKDLSVVCVASILSHLWLWHLGPETRTYMALPPLHDAPYVAFYEEGEVLATLQMWQKILSAEVPEGTALLLAEYQKHLLSRGRFYFPVELPPDMIAPEPKESPIKRQLPIPLEGLGTAKDKAGTVGQAVYAAGATFVMATRAWHRPRRAPMTFYCNYPVASWEHEGNRHKGSVKVRLAGSPLLSCLLRVFPFPSSKARFALTCSERNYRWHEKGRGGWSASVPGGSELTISW